MKIKKGDNIIVISGKDRGKGGTVLRAFPKNNKVLIEGINLVTRHQKSNQRGQQGQILKRAMPIDASNVAVKDKKTGKPVRVGYKTEGEGDTLEKIRVAQQSGEKI